MWSWRVLSIVLALLIPIAGRAVEIERLVSPGELATAHVKVESQCSKCHAPFSKQSQSTLCLACHKPIGEDILNKTGFHGRSPAVGAAKCSSCHADHKGRGADIRGLDRETFNHALTDFALNGRHRGVACADCHRSGAKFREAPNDCYGCHAKDDPHKKALGEKCATCHKDSGWHDIEFDHDKATKYPLTGAHIRVDCGLCHAGQRYKDTPTTCVACHRINDVHRGARGDDCKKCHTTKEWKESLFDHGRATKFALTGAHAKVVCVACHVGNDFKKKLSMDCLACHRADDTHQGQNGEKCEKCHSTASWKEMLFKHDTDTKFPLRGAHEKLACGTCHKGNVYTVKLAVDCKSCHVADDPHAGKMGDDCQRCHSEKSWREQVKFDHDLTRFPLVGLHATVDCELCHVDKRFKGTSMACIDCHRAKDVHKQALGDKCETCHNPNDWRVWIFDHNVQTKFRLEGAHIGLQCAACHFRPLRPGTHLASECVDCHRVDDVHNGQFGRDCARCHDTTSFAGARRRR